MKTNKQEITNQEVTPSKERAGFVTNIMPVLSKNEEYVYFFLPGDMTIVEHANRLKGVLGIPYTPKAASSEKREYAPRTGLHAKVRIFKSQDGQWVTVVLPGNMGKIVNHINAYKYAFKLPYEKKVKAVAA